MVNNSFEYLLHRTYCAIKTKSFISDGLLLSYVMMSYGNESRTVYETFFNSIYAFSRSMPLIMTR